jgi:hypothetical protein
MYLPHTDTRLLHSVVAETASNGIKAACGGAHVAESVVLLACPLGPVPLAARGLAAVLARAGPAGAVVDEHPGRAGADQCQVLARIRDLQETREPATGPALDHRWPGDLHRDRTGGHRSTVVYPFSPLGRMISTIAQARPGRTCAGAPSPTQNRRYATAVGGPGPPPQRLSPALYRVRRWPGGQVTTHHMTPIRCRCEKS